MPTWWPDWLASGASKPATNGSSSAPASVPATSSDGVFASDLAAGLPPGVGRAGCAPGDIDLIIVATSTPDMVFPSTAAILQHKLGMAGCPVFDVQAVCSGFIYALTVADAMIQTGAASKALVVGAEVFSRLLDFNDRTTCVLFGDGAGAVVLEARTRRPGILATTSTPTASTSASCACPAMCHGGQILGDPLLKMDGQAVFKLAVGVLEETAARLAGQGRQDRGRHRLADPAPGQHPHHAAPRASSSCRWTRWWSRWMSTATRRPPPFRWRWTTPCAPARSSKGDSCSCSKAWAAASPGARCCSISEPSLLIPIAGTSHERICICFPGQGSQSVGMLDAWGDHPVVAETLKEASDALGEDIGRLIHEGPKEALALTTNTQPVMLVAGVAAWRVWRAEGGALPAAWPATRWASIRRWWRRVC
jgi:hypothetical protein